MLHAFAADSIGKGGENTTRSTRNAGSIRVTHVNMTEQYAIELQMSLVTRIYDVVCGLVSTTGEHEDKSIAISPPHLTLSYPPSASTNTYTTALTLANLPTDIHYLLLSSLPNLTALRDLLIALPILYPLYSRHRSLLYPTLLSRHAEVHKNEIYFIALFGPSLLVYEDDDDQNKIPRWIRGYITAIDGKCLSSQEPPWYESEKMIKRYAVEGVLDEIPKNVEIVRRLAKMYCRFCCVSMVSSDRKEKKGFGVDLDIDWRNKDVRDLGNGEMPSGVELERVEKAIWRLWLFLLAFRRREGLDFDAEGRPSRLWFLKLLRGWGIKDVVAVNEIIRWTAGRLGVYKDMAKEIFTGVEFGEKEVERNGERTSQKTWYFVLSTILLGTPAGDMYQLLNYRTKSDIEDNRRLIQQAWETVVYVRSAGQEYADDSIVCLLGDQLARAGVQTDYWEVDWRKEFPDPWAFPPGVEAEEVVAAYGLDGRKSWIVNSAERGLVDLKAVVFWDQQRLGRWGYGISDLEEKWKNKRGNRRGKGREWGS